MTNSHIFNVMHKALEGATKIVQRYRTGPISWSLKPDNTLLTQADIEVSEYITGILHSEFPEHNIVSEEETFEWDISRPQWVLDPIDGTAQFAAPDKNEFCTALAFIEPGKLHSTLVVAPELDDEPTYIYANIKKKEILINGQLASPTLPTGHASATRTKGAPKPFDNKLESLGFILKKNTTSQTLDMLRVACKLPKLHAFDFFYRENQKIWDGASGIIASIASNNSVFINKHKINITSINALLSTNNITTTRLKINSKRILETLLP